MFDDKELVERLRSFSSDSPYEEQLTSEAADRIEELARELASWQDAAQYGR